MTITNTIKAIIFSLVCLITTNAGYAQRVVGYLPTWNNFPNSVYNIDLTKLTHINVAFANPNYSGVLGGVDAGLLATVVNAAHAKNVKVCLSIGGANASAAVYNSLLSNNNNANNFVNNLVQYAVNNNLDGIDVDIEGNILDGNSVNSSQYQSFITSLGSALHSRNKLMTAALGTWFANQVTNSAAAQFDWINVMSYDAYGTWTGPGPHSPYSLAVNDFNYWHTTKGVPASKLTVGVPFYGYSWGSYGTNSLSFATIVNNYPGAENSDQIGSGANMISYNGIPTIKQKATFAKQNAGGIMIWELTQDAAGSKSLLLAIDQVMHSGTTEGGVATMYKDCSYGGYAVSLPVGDYNMNDLIARGIQNDDISSLKVNSGYEVQLFWDYGFTGASIVVSGDNSCLVNNGWNDQATSLKVRAATNSSGTTIQAENYSNMSGVQTEGTSDAGGGLNVGWIDAGDWMAYNSINFPSSGSYTIEYRVASPGGARLSCDLNAGSIQLGAINVPATGGWQNWTTVTQTVNVNAGTYNFGIFAQAGGWNINWFRITKQGAARVAQLDDVAFSIDFEFYPNPADAAIYIKSSLDFSGGEAKVYDGMGIEILSSLVESETVDVSSLKSGIYTLVIAKDGNKISKRFMKQ